MRIGGRLGVVVPGWLCRGEVLIIELGKRCPSRLHLVTARSHDLVRVVQLTTRDHASRRPLLRRVGSNDETIRSQSRTENKFAESLYADLSKFALNALKQLL